MLSEKSLLFLLLFLPFCHFSQYDQDFIRHLSREKLQREHLTYLEEGNFQNDSSAYYKAKYYLQYADDSLFFVQIKAVKSLFFSDTLAMDYACHYFLTKAEKVRVYWFDSLLSGTEMRYHSRIERFYAYSREPKEVPADSIPRPLKENFEKYRKLAAKKPGFAALASAVVPGSGKAYIGNYRSFGTGFISLAVFFLQGRESYLKKGLTHPLTLLNAGFFGTVYVVNVYGSFRECRQKTQEFKNQYLIDVSNYFYTYSTRLYR